MVNLWVYAECCQDECGPSDAKYPSVLKKPDNPDFYVKSSDLNMMEPHSTKTHIQTHTHRE